MNSEISPDNLVSWKKVIRWGTGIGILAVLSRGSGLIREMTIAYRLGVTADLDLYYLASAIPLFMAWIGDFTANQTIIPIHAKAYEEKTPDSGWRQASGILWICTFSLTALAIVVYFAAPWLWSIIDKERNPDMTTMAILLLRISLPVMVIQSIAGWQAGLLQARKKFYTPAAAPLAFNAAIVLMLLLGAPRWGVYAFAAGVLIAESIRVLVQMFGLRSLGLRIRHFLHPDLQAARNALAHLLPIALAAGFQQSIFYSDRLMAGELPQGSVSAIVYGQRLLILPFALLVAVWATPLYSLLAESAAKKNFAQLRQWLSGGLSAAIGLGLPISIAMFFLSGPIVDVLFRRGTFDLRASMLASGAMKGYALSLVFRSCAYQLGQCCYALGRPKIPLVAFTAGAILNIILNACLRQRFFHVGIAYGTSVATAVVMIILLLVLRRTVGLTWTLLRRTLIRNLSAAAGMIGLLLLGKTFLQNQLSSGDTIVILLSLAFVGGVSSLGYLAIWKVIRQ